MEPESRLYTSPVVVLDFQSLYPSLIIAYNLCFTTAMGRPAHAKAAAAAFSNAFGAALAGGAGAGAGNPAGGGAQDGGSAAAAAAAAAEEEEAALAAAAAAAAAATGGGFGLGGGGEGGGGGGGSAAGPGGGGGIRLGVSTYAPPPAALAPGGALDGERCTVAPNGVAYAPPSARPGVLPRMLHEILATRVMVKSAMKRVPKGDKVSGRGARGLGAGVWGERVRMLVCCCRERASPDSDSCCQPWGVTRPPPQQVLARVLNARQFGLKLIPPPPLPSPPPRRSSRASSTRASLV
jgi:DNA polymerase zeta